MIYPGLLRLRTARQVNDMFSASLSHTPLMGTQLKNSQRMTATSS